ncbi:hypothetical protein NM688_g5682 [Phlebia brevispora]|uniref:Uncharacterized protein n=1 Tax=Phlebia brevispora TaxID=194682 RepID=A0ACC1SRP1_9APHY|nr:hypothetical protein NM688_g5682 [Phlebia brevispora]
MDDVKNSHLERGARRALVGLFGEGWCNAEFARLPQKIRDSLLRGLGKRTTPLNVFPLLFAAEVGLAKIKDSLEPWATVSKEMILAARKVIDDVLCTQAEQCFEQNEWLSIMEADGAHFDDGERVEWAMEAIRRGMNEKNAGMLYQVLVSSILLRPHATESAETMLSSTSHEGGFDALESWALKEISHEIEVPVEDLFSPAPPSTPKATPTRQRAGAIKPDDDMVSVHSVRTPTLRNTPRHGGDTVKSSAASVRSVARSTHSTISRTSVATTTRRTLNTRPDSKLTPGPFRGSVASSTRSVHMDSEDRSSPAPLSKSHAAGTHVRRNVLSSASTSEGSHPRSSATSFKSARSQATVRRGVSTLRPTSSLSRPASTMSTTSDGSTNFETAKSDSTPTTAARSRRVSTVSTLSTTSRRRKSSVNGKRPTPSPVDTKKLAPIPAKRTISTTSIRSTASSASTSTSRKSVVRKSGVPPTPPPKNDAPATPSTPSATVERNNTIKGTPKPIPAISHAKQESIISSSSASTVKGSLKRKKSSDTITEYNSSGPQSHDGLGRPRGATLEIGIPCIISSKKSRFRAYARYIGEVEGEVGPWVGVEVPVGEDWTEDKLEGHAPREEDPLAIETLRDCGERKEAYAPKRPERSCTSTTAEVVCCTFSTASSLDSKALRWPSNMFATLVRMSKASRRPLTPKRGNKDYYKGTRQAFLPGGPRTGPPGKHVIKGKSKYRLVDEQVRYFVAPPVDIINNSPLKPYVSVKASLTLEQRNEIYGKLPPGGLTPQYYLQIAPKIGQEAVPATTESQSS